MKVAIFGGTFDPVHLGHLEVATAAADEFELDKVLLIPAGRPPHKRKRELAPYQDRYEMVRLACVDDSRFEPSRLEEPGSDRPSYSIYTIERVREELSPDDRLFVILGADAFNDLPSWYRADDVLRLAEFIVVSRPESVVNDLPGASYVRLDGIDNPVSASGVRARLREGLDCGSMIPAAIDEYIRTRGLYRNQSSL